ncbi:MAG: hypothetical protein QOE10_1085 [Gaiellales bacterium]|nr:hypothetical protein [Gaiellales bacterium]
MGRTPVAVLMALALLGATATASASPSALSGTFTVQFPKGHPASNAPCDPDTFCGVGVLVGYGAATITILDESFDEIAGSSCLAVTRVERLDLLEGDGALEIESAGMFCRPGGSGDSHASPSSWGSPGRWNLRFEVLGADSTGVFTGASGGGKETMDVNGGIGVWHLDGEVGAGAQR